MDRGAWQALVHTIAESQTRLKRLSIKLYWRSSGIYVLSSLVAQMVKSLAAVQATWVQSLGHEDPLE